jgi:hypothetical protein
MSLPTLVTPLYEGIPPLAASFETPVAASSKRPINSDTPSRSQPQLLFSLAPGNFKIGDNQLGLLYSVLVWKAASRECRQRRP